MNKNNFVLHAFFILLSGTAFGSYNGTNNFHIKTPPNKRKNHKQSKKAIVGAALVNKKAKKASTVKNTNKKALKKLNQKINTKKKK